MNGFVLLLLLPSVLIAAPSDDKMASPVPGFPAEFNTSVYSGYLDLKNESRSAHYVFVESINGPGNKDPVTLWLNGGPGCSSLLGFLQEIGPFYLQDGKNYKDGDKLTPNPYSWHRVSNLLFLQSPAGVGFSYNNDQKFVYTDTQTAQDNFNSVLDFFKKFPEYNASRFWIAGESYAGKYIPDLAVLVDKYNTGGRNLINFKGILIGNGIMTFQTLEKAQIDYMIDRSFTDPQTLSYWKTSCMVDPHSAGCRYFNIRYQEDVDELNPYSNMWITLDVYGYCFYNDSFDANNTRKDATQTRRSSQESILLDIIKQLKREKQSGMDEKLRGRDVRGNAENKEKYQKNAEEAGKNGAPCAYFDGMFNYFNLHGKEYHAKFPNMRWNGPCAENITYNIDPSGSMESYRYLLGRLFDVNYQIHLYSGTWDAVVPYHDTVQGIRLLNLYESYLYTPWFTEEKQHSGFMQIYSGVVFTTVKGASHQVPQTKREASLEMFNATLQGHKQHRKKYEQFKLRGGAVEQ